MGEKGEDGEGDGASDEDEAEEGEEGEDEAEVNDRRTVGGGVLYQLQALFSYLAGSRRRTFDPRAFCFAFKDLDGRPTSTHLQQDSDEFLLRLADKVEEDVRKWAGRAAAAPSVAAGEYDVHTLPLPALKAPVRAPGGTDASVPVAVRRLRPPRPRSPGPRPPFSISAADKAVALDRCDA